jgi:hypothetical protein
MATRLEQIQQDLENRGVKDVKFAFSEDINKVPKSEVEESICEVLEAHLNGKFSALSPLHDKWLAK